MAPEFVLPAWSLLVPLSPHRAEERWDHPYASHQIDHHPFHLPSPERPGQKTASAPQPFDLHPSFYSWPPLRPPMYLQVSKATIRQSQEPRSAPEPLQHLGGKATTASSFCPRPLLQRAMGTKCTTDCLCGGGAFPSTTAIGSCPSQNPHWGDFGAAGNGSCLQGPLSQAGSHTESIWSVCLWHVCEPLSPESRPIYSERSIDFGSLRYSIAC